MDISKAIVAKSDQMNAIDLARDVTVTVLDVKKGPDDQPVHIITDIYGPARPFKPSRTVLRDIAQAWGLESQVWIGRRLTLFNDPTVLWAGQEVGGIRVRAMSHIDKAFESKHAISRTKSKKVMIQPLAAPNEALIAKHLAALSSAATIAELQAAWESASKEGVASDPSIGAAKDRMKLALTSPAPEAVAPIQEGGDVSGTDQIGEA